MPARSHRRWYIAGLALAVVAALIVGVYAWSPRAALTITTGPQGTAAQQLVTALRTVIQAQYPFIRLDAVDMRDLAESAKAIDAHTVDIAIVRTDVAPINGQTVAFLRRDAAVLVLPPGSNISTWADLANKSVVIPKGPLATYNAAVLDLILNYYNVPPASVKRLVLPMEEIGQHVHRRYAHAVFAIGPVGPGEIAAVTTAVAKATRGTPTLLTTDDDTDAVVQRFPAFESLDIPQGAFKANPAVPSDSATTVAVSYRFVVTDTMLNIVAGAVARAVFNTKAKAMALTPAAAQIEAPDTDATYAILPVHPGVSAYLSSGEQSFFDEFQQYFYLGGMLLSVLGSGYAIISARMRAQRSDEELDRTRMMIQLAERATTADPQELVGIEHELNALAAWFLNRQADGAISAEAFSAFSVGLSHARHTVETRKAFHAGATGLASPRTVSTDIL